VYSKHNAYRCEKGEALDKGDGEKDLERGNTRVAGIKKKTKRRGKERGKKGGVSQRSWLHTI